MNKLFSYKISSYADKRLAQAIEEIFEKSNAVKALNSESRVLLKPNLLAKHIPAQAVTTHPEIVKQVILALRRRGITAITVADSPAGAYRTELLKGIYDTCGMTSVCEQAGAQLYTQCKYGSKLSQGKLCRSWNFIQPVLQADFIINLPKLKTHMMMNLSCAVKNLFGCIPGLQKAELHMRFPEKERFASMLCDLYEAVAPGLTIADAVIGMEGNGPAGGTPRFCGWLLASESAPTVDMAACRLIGFNPHDVLYLAELQQRGACSELPMQAQPCADALQPITGFKLPSGSGNIDFSNSLPRAFAPVLTAFRRISAPRPKINKGICIGCGKCAEICPASVITLENKKAHISHNRCIKCFCCHEVCPVKAIDVKRFALYKL